jgi:hypothetical protein
MILFSLKTTFLMDMMLSRVKNIFTKSINFIWVVKIKAQNF